MKRWIVALLILVTTLVLMTARVASAEGGLAPTSGECGENVTWALDEDGVLTISGTGAMANYNSSGDQPWQLKRDSIVRVVVEEGVTSIGNYAFCYLGNLTEAVLPSGLERVGYYTFADASQLANIELPESLTTIEGGAFRYCRALTDIAIPDSVTSIGTAIFYECRYLVSAKLPKDMTVIPEQVFSWCTGLKTVTLPERFTTISNGAFNACISLEEIHLPDSLTTVIQGAFNDCNALADVYYEGTQAEARAISIAGYNGPLVNATWHYLSCEGGHDWGEPVFAWSDDHRSVTATRVCSRDETHVQTLEGVVTATVSRSPTQTEPGEITYTAVFEDGITTSESLEDIPALDDMDVLILPGDLTAIGEEAFMNAACQAVIVPEGCTSIGEGAFAGCTELIYVRVPAGTQIAEDAFEGCPQVLIDRLD